MGGRGRYALALMLITPSAAGWWPTTGSRRRPRRSTRSTTRRTLVSVRARPAHPRRRLRGSGRRRTPMSAASSTRRTIALGAPAVASALVIIPADPPPGRPPPSSAWNHGTTGVAPRAARRACATPPRHDWAIPALDDAMARGWVVVASDYSGQGAPGVFPYLIGEGEARSSLDAVLAAREPRRVPSRALAVLPRTVAVGVTRRAVMRRCGWRRLPRYTPESRSRPAVARAGGGSARARRRTHPGDAGALLSVLISWVLVPYAEHLSRRRHSIATRARARGDRARDDPTVSDASPASSSLRQRTGRVGGSPALRRPISRRGRSASGSRRTPRPVRSRTPS